MTNSDNHPSTTGTTLRDRIRRIRRDAAGRNKIDGMGGFAWPPIEISGYKMVDVIMHTLAVLAGTLG